MKCAIMQPTYLPWLGYFNLIKSVDTFVILDHVQFEKQSWQQRNRIGSSTGEIMLTVPVLHESGLQRRISDVKIDHSRKPLSKHLTSIRHAYSKTPNFGTIFPLLEQIYNHPFERLIDLNMSLIRFGMQQLSIDTPIVFSGDMHVEGQRVEALIDICTKLHADKYLSPVGSKGYIDENNLFPVHNIELSYQTYTHPVYPQVQTPAFISHLSFIDCLFNNTTNQSLI